MDKVITVNDFWDQPRLGVATVDGITCIYERIFSSDLDEYSDFYYLTPILPETIDILIKDWNNWLQWMRKDNTQKHAHTWRAGSSASLEELAHESQEYHKYCRRARFEGTYINAYSEINNFYVTWFL